jgi:hypothetical protein
MTLAGMVLAVGAVILWSVTGSGGPHSSVPTAPLSPAQARQQQILEQNIGRPGDPDLTGRYLAINTRHFGAALPLIPVRWEPALSDVGKLASHSFTLEGMFGRLGKDVLILINPNVRDDDRALDRALSHEMVHFYLHTTGDHTTNHGPEFKRVLARLAEEGAFEGRAGTEGEKAALRAWLDAESTRLDMDQRELALIGSDLNRERNDLDRLVTSLNDRTATGERPNPDDVQALEARRDRFNAAALEANHRIEKGRAALAHFNEEVARYNLMLVYPDGIDEEGRVPTKAAAP